MKIQLVSRVRIPHGGSYDIKDPANGQPISGTNFEMLLDRAAANRRANNLHIGLEFEEEIERELCKDYPAECQPVPHDKLRLRTELGFWDAVRGTQALLLHKAAGSPLVSQEEANRRAAICQKCPMNIQMHMPCVRCFSAMENVVRSIIAADHSTPYDDRLKSCSICGCWTSAAVWVPLDIQAQSVTESMKEQFSFARSTYGCWKEV